jgi:5'-nucleotidase
MEIPELLVLFSGDIFSPSVSKIGDNLVSTMFKGEHMVPVIDELEIDVACVGNHDYVRIF